MRFRAHDAGTTLNALRIGRDRRVAAAETAATTMSPMQWRADPQRPRCLVLVAHECVVARIEPHGAAHLVHVRYADVHVIAVTRTPGAARRFAEGELWSGAGELPGGGWPGPCNGSVAAPRPARSEPEVP